MTMGYGMLHSQSSTTVLNQVHKTKQTLNGPIFGTVTGVESKLDAAAKKRDSVALLSWYNSGA